MNTDSFIGYVKTNDINKEIAEDFKLRLDTLNYELDIPLSKENNKKII